MAKDHWLTLGGISSGALAKPEQTCDPQTAAALATLLFGCYRASEANDPEAFMAAAAATLSRYPTQVVIDVCDPIRGLPSRDKWLPSIAEIRMACDEKMRPVRDQERRDRLRDETLAGRTTRKAPVGSPEHQRVVEGFRKLQAELRANSAEVDPRRAPPPDARTAQTPELRDKAVAYHEGKLAELAATPKHIQSSTPEMADYLARMRGEAEDGGQDAPPSR